MLPSLPCSPAAAGAPQEGTGAAEDLATPKLDSQLMRGRVGCVLGLDLVSAAVPYLIRQLATAPP